MQNWNNTLILELGTVIVAIIITLGFVVSVVLGRNPDGLSAGFLAVIGLFLGGGIVKVSMGAANTSTKETAVAAAQANTQTAATVLSVSPVDQHTPQASANPPTVPPVDHVG